MDWIELGYIGLFLGTLLAATVVPFSSEFILTGLLIAHFDPFLCWLIATVGNSLGSAITYGMGRLLEYEKAMRKLKLSEKNIQRSTRFFNKYGVWIALFSWAPVLGDAGIFVLGSNKVSFPKTLFLVFIGKATRFAIVILIFYSIV